MLAGRYRVTHLVAEGGMGRVYAAEQLMGQTQRKVAIKVLLAEYSGRDQDMQRFSRECSTVTELEHPNTIKFYDYGDTAQGDLFIAMEFLSGDSLAQIVKLGPLPPDRVDLIIGQICGSLQEAHDHGIVHRDLKPDNIILTSPGGAPDFVKVLDFGIAKRTNSRDPKLTPLGVVLGSPPYMSPEQFTMQEVDPRSDIYSLGVVAYQMLTGKLPFSATDPLEWAALHMGVAPAPVDSHGMVVPFEMRCAIHRALAKETSQRPQTMREFFSEFTIGSGTLAPGRASSMLPTPASMMPFPPPPRAPSQLAPAPPAFVSELPPRPSSLARSVPPFAASAAHGFAPPPRTLDANGVFSNEHTLDEDGEPLTRSKSDESDQPTRVKPEAELAAAAGLELRSDVSTRAQATFVLDGAPSPSTPGPNEPATLRDPVSQPEISFHEMSASDLSLPPSDSAALANQTATSLKSSKGTIVMAASEPPPRARLTMPDLLPPTIRDAQELANAGKPRGRLWLIAVVLIAIGAIASGLGWFFFLRAPGTQSSKSKPQSSAISATSLPAATTAPPVSSSAPPAMISAAPPSPSSKEPVEPDKVEPKEKLSPCQTVIFSAVSGKCDLAKRAYARCPEDSPYRASATRATALCP